MAARIRKANLTAAVAALAAEVNRGRDANVGSNFHASATSKPVDLSSDPPTVTALTITAANASDLATSITLVQNIKAVVNVHFQDASAHNSAVMAVVSTADVDLTKNAAGQLADAIALANAIKTAYNTGGHINASNVHFNNDATNTISSAAASDQSSLNTLLNELKTDINAHMAGALAGYHVELVDS